MCAHKFVGDVCVRVKSTISSYTFTLGHCDRCKMPMSDFDIKGLFLFSNASIIYHSVCNYLNKSANLKDAIYTLYKYGKCTIVPLRRGFCYEQKKSNETIVAPGPIVPTSPIKRLFSRLFNWK